MSETIYCSRCRQCVPESEVEAVTQAPRHGIHKLCGGLVRFDADCDSSWQARALKAEAERDEAREELQKFRDHMALSIEMREGR